MPYADAGVPLIHERDLAEAVALVLLDERFDGSRVGVSGRPVSAVDRVRVLCEVTGLPIELDRVSAEDAPAVLGSTGMADHDVEHLLTTLRWFSENDDTTYQAAEELLGRPLRDFTTWAREHATAFVPRSPGPANP